MRRPSHIWLAFAVCLALIAAALAWLTRQALTADRAERAARYASDVDASVGLALWRMDSLVAPLVAQENALPVASYLAATTSPLPNAESQELPTILRFQDGPGGFVSSSPQQGNLPWREQLAGLGPQLPSPTAPPIALPAVESTAADDPFGEPLNDAPNQPATPYQPSAALAQKLASTQLDYESRKRSVEQSNRVSQVANAPAIDPFEDPTASDRPAGLMRAVWMADNLLLARRIGTGDRGEIQGALVDWPKLKRQLLDEVSDLLPEASLVPVRDVQATPEVRLLASLPVQLLAGAVPFPLESGLSSVQWSLLCAWSAMLVAAAAIGLLLHGVISLSERRAAFVSAVTHELRTPLTTFRMYSEMLAQGMVREESDRQKYLETLRLEAERLTHLVANVLAYARLERGGAGGRVEVVSIEKLLEVATQRLADRATQCGMTLVIEAADDVKQIQVRADSAAVEQILFNLVDNACKYAAEAADRTLRLSVAVDGRNAVVRLCDHGPGISPPQQRLLFQPFRKSARDAAHSAPGVGLGLSLCRRLARDMHGELRYETQTDGACFALIMPLA